MDEDRLLYLLQVLVHMALSLGIPGAANPLPFSRLGIQSSVVGINHD